MICYYSDDELNISPCVLALGNFDGVHKGHKYLLDRAQEYAKHCGLKFGIFTFDTHPKLSAGDNTVKLLSSNEERIRLFKESGADFVYFENFSKVRSFEREQFALYVCKKLGAQCVFCGENFRYAKDASGDCVSLKNDMESIGKTAHIVPLLREGGDFISSSRIRGLLESGDVKSANMLLGHDFCIDGKVLHGNSIGHTIGFPTVNVGLSQTLVKPLYGVYASKIYIGNEEYNGVTNVGVKPTVSDDTENVLAETNIFGFDGDVYDKHIRVCLCNLMRKERKFSNLDELKNSIYDDVENTKKYFGELDK